ncbi:MAG: Holliday junction branch migration protein RuvA [Lachnospiraceae bacterium]|nr:Holliday junction branch migration protein RuvA [Lachnospiraceae bacterium]
MISFLNGICAEIEEETIHVDVSGVGFEVHVPAGCIRQAPGIGEAIFLYTYLSVREDNMSLFGFLTREELRMFQLLITVSGIGPKVALSMLSAIPVDDLRFAILTSDARLITAAPGVGKKTAERLVLELRDKLAKEDIALPERGSTQPAETVREGAAAEALEALCALGYARSDAMTAIRRADTAPEADTETILKAALKELV